MGRIAEHMNIEQLGHISTSPRVVLLSERGPNVGALFLNDCPFIGGGSSGSNLPDQIPQSHRWSWKARGEPGDSSIE